MAQRNQISLCIITKNDERFLSNCLENMKEVVDEIVIVDIGSTDATINIGEQAGANIYQMEWKNNYSEAKNICLDKATGRWVLFLQANEIIPVEQIRKIFPLLHNPNIEGYLMQIDYSWKNYRISSPVQALRLFRNRKEYRYKYKVFERVPDEILNNIKEIDIQIVQQEGHELSSDIDSFILLLEDEQKENSDNSYLQYIYGIELLNHQNYEESIIYFEKACRNANHDYYFVPHLYKCLSWAFISLQKYTDALNILDEGVKIFPFYIDLLVLRGELLNKFQRYEEAIQDLEKNLEMRMKSNFTIPSSEINASVVLEILGDVNKEIFNYQSALDYYKQSYNLNQNNQKILYKIGEMADKLDFKQVIGELLKVAIEEGNLQQLVILMDILFNQREYTQVLAYVEYLELLIGKGEQTESIKTFCYIMLGEVEKAKDYFSSMDIDSSFYNNILLQLIESCWINDEWREASQLLDEMDKINNIDISTKILYRRIHELLIKQVINYSKLEKKEYEIVITMLENFLWFNKVDKAQLLLPFLLKDGEDDQYIKLAEVWIVVEDYLTIERIFWLVIDEQKQLEFKRKVLDKLLRTGHIEAAKKIITLGKSQSLGVLEYILWLKELMGKLNQLKRKMMKWNMNLKMFESLDIEMPNKPTKNLFEFYCKLLISKHNINKCNYDFNDEEMNSSKVHGEIGELFIKLNKKKEALIAYLYVLQWNPIDTITQKKIRDLIHENSSLYSFLEQKYWNLEGEFFQNKQDFVNYVIGIINFNKHKFNKALEYFLKISDNEKIYPIVSAYIISSLWLDGNEEEGERLLIEQREASYIFSLFYNICKKHILDKLEEWYKEYPYSELITLEKQKILNNSC